MKTEVAVIGGGATGAGVIRDLALRGIDAVLLEKDELTSGTSGRNHGLLHSGARYAVLDPHSARECIQENRVLKKIASPCVEDTGGYFLSLPGDPPDYPARLLRSCAELGIEAERVSVEEVLRREPAISPEIREAIGVPDASLDPFRLIRSNAEDAERLGARVFAHREVVGVMKEGGRVAGLKWRDPGTGEESSVHCRFIVNAAGVWAGGIARLAGASLPIVFSKGSLIVLNRRLVHSVINRCRPPSSGDILVPNGPALIMGTTSRVLDDLVDPAVEESEVDLLLSEGEKLIPGVKGTRAIRAYAGIRPLLGAPEDKEEDNRRISRDFLFVDHGASDGVKGFYSLIGGKLTTYRLMAEQAVDALSRAMGRKDRCRTAEKPLPFPKDYSFHDHADRWRRISKSSPQEILCECELVTKNEILGEIRNLTSPGLSEIQKRTRAGMGPCQGGFCSHRLTALLCEGGKIPAEASLSVLKDFLEERWKGIRPLLWGAQLREEQLIQALYAELFNMDH